MSHYGSLGRISEQLARIADGVDSTWVAFSAIGTFLAVVVAVIGIDEIRSLFFKPCIRREEPKLVRTEHHRKSKPTLIYHRLIVKNAWGWLSRSARDVRVLLTYCNNPRNFIPIPLRWTYWNTFERDISRGEPAYLDIFEEKQGAVGSDYEFCWAGDVAGSGSAEGNLKVFYPHLGDLRLEFYERSGGKIGDIKLKYCQGNETKDYFAVTDYGDC